MKFDLKQFSELSTKDLFEIYQLRSKVFVVEQNCPYQDVDEKDLEAYHLTMRNEWGLVGYSRILPPTDSYTHSRIGRVVVDAGYRKKNFGRELMKHSINQSLELFKYHDIMISAQTYLLEFYTLLGFKVEGEYYLEDNIPHIKMRLVADQRLYDSLAASKRQSTGSKP